MPSFPQLPYLTNLVNLSTTSPSFGNVPNLTKLDYLTNKIYPLDVDSLLRLSSLRTVNLTITHTMNLEFVSLLTNLKKLDTYLSNSSYFSSLPSSLQHLTAPSTINSLHLRNLVNLKMLDIQGATGHIVRFSHMTSLHTLILNTTWCKLDQAECNRLPVSLR